MTREEANKELERAFDVLDHTCHMDNRRKEAFNMARVALSAEPCEDAISREEVCDYIAEFVNHEYATDREREMVKNIIGGIQHLPSIQPTAKENLVVEDCISRKQAMKACYQMAVRTGIEEMPYKYAETELAHLPSIQPKTGHWIVYEDCEGKTRRCVCDRCRHETGDYTWKNPNFCENCGAKMVEPFSVR